MDSTFTAHGQGVANGSFASTATWANDAFTRVLHVPIRELRREGTPEEASPKFLSDVLEVLRKTYRRREDPATGDVTYAPAPRGAITVGPGAELATARFASLGHRGQVLIDDALVALDAIDPIGVTDPETLSITTAMVREELELLARELADEPSSTHVDQLFDSLLGTDRSNPAGGHIGELAEQAGLNDRNVVTEGHEVSLTKWQILRDHVASLAGNWDEISTEEAVIEHPLSRLTEAIGIVGRSADLAAEALAAEGLDEDSLDLLELGRERAGKGASREVRASKASLGNLLFETQRQVPFWREIVEVAGRRGADVVGPHASSLRRQLDRLLPRSKGASTREILLALKEEDQFTRFWKALALMHDGLTEIEDVASGLVGYEYGETRPMPADS